MPEIPREINFTSGLNATGFPLILNGALAMAEFTLHPARKSAQVRNTLDSPNNIRLKMLGTLQKHIRLAFPPPENIFGLACIKNTSSVCLNSYDEQESDLEGNQ